MSKTLGGKINFENATQMWMMVMEIVKVRPIMQICIWMKKIYKILQRENLKPMCLKKKDNIHMDDADYGESNCDKTHVDDD